VVNVGKNEVLCRDTKDREVGSKVSLSVEKENIQVMKKNFTVNQYTDAWINKENQLVISDDVYECNVLSLIPGSVFDEDGRVYDPKTKKHYDFNDADVIAEVDLDKVELSDDLSIGNAKGTILSSVWIGDHYRYLVRTEEEEDYVVSSPYSWNENDIVSISIKKEDIRIRLKGSADQYAQD
jgi:spermidine/putrescine transport system ATP-binding protein